MKKENEKLTSVCQKTPCFKVFDKKTTKTRLSKFLEPRSLLWVNNCCKNESNAVFGVFLQRLTKKTYIPPDIKVVAIEVEQTFFGSGINMPGEDY